MLVYDQSELIAKEEIAFYSFPKEEVLKQLFRKDLRKKNILSVIKRNKLNEGLVNIFFEDNESLKKVVSEIKEVTQEGIILKNDTLIPINRIHYIKLGLN